MAAVKKRRGEAAAEAASAAGGDERDGHNKDLSSDEDGEGDIIDVDFDFFDPKPIDFHAVKNLLANLFEDDVVNLSELADFLVQEETSIGTCVKVEGGADPYSFLSVLSLSAHKTKPFVKQIRDYLLSKCKGELRARLTQILDDPANHVGMIFNERLLNMPVQISPPSFQMLLEEMQWANNDGLPFKFKYIIFLMKAYKETRLPDDPDAHNLGSDDDDGAHSSGSSKGTDAKRKRMAKEPRASGVAALSDKPELLFFNEEEEYFLKDAIFSLEYKMPRGRATSRFLANGIQPYRKLVVVEASKVPAIVKRMKAEITEDALQTHGSQTAASSHDNEG